MNYVIGDVHGNFNTLLSLKDKLSKDDELIFVGDLVDRGKYSKEVLKFIRDNNYLCSLGNHDKMMIEFGEVFLKNLPVISLPCMFQWFNSGGIETLQSYDLIHINKDKISFNKKSNYIKQFEDDVNWLKTLPLYIEFDALINNRKVVISHSCVSNVWDKKDDKRFSNMFEEFVLWNRKIPSIDSEIFNIFGHTPQKFKVTPKDNYICIDTGCYLKDHEYGKLSAFCIETKKIISINRNKDD